MGIENDVVSQGNQHIKAYASWRITDVKILILGIRQIGWHFFAWLVSDLGQ